MWPFNKRKKKLEVVPAIHPTSTPPVKPTTYPWSEVKEKKRVIDRSRNDREYDYDDFGPVYATPVELTQDVDDSVSISDNREYFVDIPAYEPAPTYETPSYTPDPTPSPSYDSGPSYGGSDSGGYSNSSDF